MGVRSENAMEQVMKRFWFGGTKRSLCGSRMPMAEVWDVDGRWERHALKPYYEQIIGEK